MTEGLHKCLLWKGRGDIVGGKKQEGESKIAVIDMA